MDNTELKLNDIYDFYLSQPSGGIEKGESQSDDAINNDDVPGSNADETVNDEPQPSKQETESSEIKPAVSKKQKAKEEKAERFKRVREDEVEFLDARLRDNTFLAKPCAVNSYGHKAHQDLVVTKGKGFLKAKNKKKKGSYRGGAIDTGSHSIKFDD